jgi:predicted transcriptional regulator
MAAKCPVRGAENPPHAIYCGSCSSVNYDVFRKYIAWMSERGSVKIENSPDGHERIALTPKGLEAYGRLVQWVNEVIHGKSPWE